MVYEKLLAVSRGDQPADLILTNGRVINVYSGEILDTDVAIVDGMIAGFGPYEAAHTCDLQSRFVAPGFIDAHVHIESAMAVPPEFARAVLPRGTTAVVADPHEIANVLGTAGLDYMIAATSGLPLQFFFTLPSCVPATTMETAGATLNPAEYFNLHQIGAVAPGKRADLVVLNDLETVDVDQVYTGGRIAAAAGTVAPDLAWPAAGSTPPAMHVDPRAIDLGLKAVGDHIRVIDIVPEQIVTGAGIARTAVRDGLAVADPQRDLLKIAVIERHRGSGRTGIGFVRGMGLTCGALASSVAHDAHNIVVIGAEDHDMRTAADRVAAMGGGLAVVSGEEVIASLALPIAGLMSPRPITAIDSRLQDLLTAARRLGTTLPDPFMTLAFLALPVIPALKITDHGLVDVARFRVVPLFTTAAGKDIES